MSLTWFSLVAERHWPQAVSGRWKPGGGEVCSHPYNVDVPGGVCGGRIRLRRDQVPGWRLSARLHSGWQSRTRKVCIRGKCAPGDSLSAVVTSDRLHVPLSSARPRRCAQSFWGCFRFNCSGRLASMVNEMSPVDKLVSLMTKVCILLELFWFDSVGFHPQTRRSAGGRLQPGRRREGEFPNHRALEARNWASGGKLVSAVFVGYFQP